MQHLTPRQIVSELDKYIIGQADAKRAVAVAIRNRWRRQQLPEGHAAGCFAQKYHHDRPDRRRKNRNRPPAGRPHRAPVHQSRSDEIHRGRLSRPRCGFHDPRSARFVHRAGPRGNDRVGHGAGRRAGRGAAAGSSSCPANRAAAFEDDDEAKAKRSARPRKAARATQGRRAGRPPNRNSDRAAPPPSACWARPGWRWTSSSSRCWKRCCPPGAKPAE